MQRARETCLQADGFEKFYLHDLIGSIYLKRKRRSDEKEKHVVLTGGRELPPQKTERYKEPGSSNAS